MKGLDGKFGSWLRWWRERVPIEDKIVLGLVVLVALLIGGWIAATSFSVANASAGDSSSESLLTVDRLVTVRDPVKPVTTVVRVVKPVYRTRTATLPGTTVVETQTTYGTSTVTVPRDVTQVVTAPARTVTETQTVTDLTTTVEWRVVTVVEKSKPVTVTVQAP